MNVIKTIKKYQWWIVGGIAAYGFYHFVLRRAYIGNDPGTGVPGKDNFHLYCSCKNGMLIGRCVDADGTSHAGDPCVDLGNIDPKLSTATGIKDPGGEGTIVRPRGSQVAAMMM